MTDTARSTRCATSAVVPHQPARWLVGGTPRCDSCKDVIQKHDDAVVQLIPVSGVSTAGQTGGTRTEQAVLDDPDLRVPDPDGVDHDYCDHQPGEGTCELDDATAGWDIGTWCRLNFVRRGDGTFYVSVHKGANTVALHRTVTPEQLRLMAQHLLTVAGDDPADAEKRAEHPDVIEVEASAALSFAADDERDRIVTWLRGFSPALDRKFPDELADAIERGEHR